MTWPPAPRCPRPRSSAPGAWPPADRAPSPTRTSRSASPSCYELHYRGFDEVSDDWEWDPALLRLRAGLERRHLGALRDLVGPSAVTDEPIDRQLTALIAADDGPSLSSFMAKQGTLEQWREYLTLRSVYHLKEADPHTFAIPRLSGRAKAAMVEIQADEYGGGAVERMHSELFAGLLRSLDLDATYGALWNDAPAAAFASVNTMSLFGLHRRWRGAALGHLAAVEMTSSEPSRRYSAGLRRLGFDEHVTVFYDEHVEADAVHEQIASVDMCGSLVAEQPDLASDVLFGAACSLAMDGVAADHLLGAWEDRPLGAAPGTQPRRLIGSRLRPSAGLAKDLRGGAGPARCARCREPRTLVRAVAEGLDAGLPAPAERDRPPSRVDLVAVLVDEPELAANDQRTVPIGRDRRAVARVTRGVDVLGRVRLHRQ